MLYDRFAREDKWKIILTVSFFGHGLHGAMLPEMAEKMHAEVSFENVK